MTAASEVVALSTAPALRGFQPDWRVALVGLGGEQRSMGDVTLNMFAKDEATGSLDRLLQTGELTNWGTGEEVEVDGWIIDAVHTWAEEEGY